MNPVIPQVPVIGKQALRLMSDVSLSSPSSGQILRYNGTDWVNATPTEWLNIADLLDVTITTPVSGNVLQYNGSVWVNVDPSTLSIALDNLSDVTLSSPAEGNILYYDATSSLWKNTGILSISDTSNAIGVGTTSPQRKLHLASGDGESGTQAAFHRTNTSTSSSLFSFRMDTTGTGATTFVETAAFGASHEVIDHATRKSSLRFYTATAGAAVAERMRISGLGNLVVGTLAGDGDCLLHVWSATAGSVSAPTNTVAALENSTAAYLSFLTPNNVAAGIYFGDPNDNDVGRLYYDHSADSLHCYVNASEALRITSALRLGIGATAPEARIHVASSAGSPFIMERMSGSAGTVPGLILRRTMTTTQGDFTAPASGDGVFFQFQFANGSAFVNGAAIVVRATETHASGSAGQKLEFYTIDNTTTTTDLRMTIDQDGSVVVGSPTGGSKGVGTINAVAVYDDNTLLTDFVFEPDYPLLSIQEMKAFYEERLHLPWIEGMDVWKAAGNRSLGQLISQLWETIEVYALYITELDERLAAVENRRVFRRRRPHLSGLPVEDLVENPRVRTLDKALTTGS